MAVTGLNEHLLFPVHKWQPASGRTLDFHKWVGGRNMLIAAFGLTVHEFEHLDFRTPVLDITPSTSRSEAKLLRQQYDEHVRRLQHWLAVNTAIFWHLRPSIVISQGDFLKHTRYIDSLYDAHMANGQKLSEWALRFVDMSGKPQQIKLLRGLAAAQLKEGSDRAALSAHAQQMLQVWLLLAGSDPRSRESLADLYDYLLHSLPTKPEGAHLTSLRTWFAGMLTEFKAGGRPDFMNYDDCIDVLLAHAETLGIPSGDAGKHALLAPHHS